MKVRDLGKTIADFELSNIPRLIGGLLLLLSIPIIYLARLYNILFWLIFPLTVGFYYLTDNLFEWQKPWNEHYLEDKPFKLSFDAGEVLPALVGFYVVSVLIWFVAKRFKNKTSSSHI